MYWFKYFYSLNIKDPINANNPQITSQTAITKLAKSRPLINPLLIIILCHKNEEAINQNAIHK